jgi:hypothetical protein
MRNPIMRNPVAEAEVIVRGASACVAESVVHN